MSLDRNFGGIIWTNHAVRRMQERGIKQGDAWATWRRPDQTWYGKAKGTWVYYRTFPATNGARGHQRIEVVAKKMPPAHRASGPAGKKWVILSVWNRPVVAYAKGKREKKSLGKMFLDGLLGRR